MRATQEGHPNKLERTQKLKERWKNMGVSTHSIEVNAPLRAVYNQWTQFEEFPHFMEGVEEVRQEGKKRLFWKAKIAGLQALERPSRAFAADLFQCLWSV
jgi:uncharacterized membrane protein